MEFAQKLVSSRRGSLYVAVVAAVLAAVAVLAYVNSYRDNVNAGTTPVTVLVARQAIAKGTVGSVIASKRLYTAATIRESQLREGAISDPASLRGKVAAADIFEGAQLTAADFSASPSSDAGTLIGRQRIVAVPLDAAHGLLGQLEKGDRVDVYAGFNVIPVRPNGTPQSGGQARPVLRLIMQNVAVVRIGSASGLGSRTTTVGLRVNDEQAAKLAFASDNGKVWLALRPAVGAKPSSPGIVTAETLLLGIPPVTVVQALAGRQ
jgi:Flp pilus assembly protein CpaB